MVLFWVIKSIQIQHLLKLNLYPFYHPLKFFNSNTTFVKVKSIASLMSVNLAANSNTTFVKVKYYGWWKGYANTLIQIQHLLKLNRCWKY